MRLLKLTEQNLPTFTDRVMNLKPDTPGKWGKLDVSGMIRHLRFGVEMSLAEIPIEDHSTFFTRNVMRPIAFHVLPTWPKGKLKVPEHLTPKPDGPFSEERDKFLAALARFTATAAKEPQRVTVHEVFGPLTFEYWTFFHARHFEHHFQQFGV